MRKQRAERLRFAVQTLPPETQRAMLEGIKENRIVTGANTDRRGGVCPMLAADRNAFSVTPLAEIFATAWDKYTGTSFVNVTRREASDRDLKVLRSMLETSLALHASAEPVAAAPRPALAAAPSPPPARPELVETQRTLTVAAKLEVIRALEAAGHLPPAPRVADARDEAAPAPRPASSRLETTVADRRASRVRPAPARTGAVRPPATRTDTELERERARAIIANQASTLRRRAWPRPAAPAPTPVEARPAVAPATLPAPAPVPTPMAAPRREQRDQVQELAARSGWAWLRPFSSYDDYEQTLQDLGETQRGPGADDGGTHREDTKRRQPLRT